MQPEFYERIEGWLSRERLDAYARRLPDADVVDVISQYFWNTALSHSLYPTLQFFEVALRNSMHRELTRAYGTERWFSDEGGPALQSFHYHEVEKAKKNLQRSTRHRLRAADPPEPTPGMMIAKLNFGFWVGLFGKSYHTEKHPIWRGSAITNVFPYIPQDESARRRNRRIYRTPSAIHERLDRIVELRNRISHHEPIWYWSKPPRIRDLGAQHREIFEVMHWIDPALCEAVRLLDTLPDVYDAGPSPYRAMLSSFMQRLHHP